VQPRPLLATVLSFPPHPAIRAADNKTLVKRTIILGILALAFLCSCAFAQSPVVENVYNNIDDVTLPGGWQWPDPCSNLNPPGSECAGGTGTPTAPPVQSNGISSPSLDGASMLATFDAESGLPHGETTNVLWDWKVPGTFDPNSTYFWTIWHYYFPVVTGMVAQESDQFKFDASDNRYMMGTECDSASLSSGKVRTWNSLSGAWITQTTPCTIITTANTWHTLILATHVDPSTSTACSGHPCMYYDAYAQDGSVAGPYSSEPASISSETKNNGTQTQLDWWYNGGTASEYIDESSLTIFDGKPVGTCQNFSTGSEASTCPSNVPSTVTQFYFIAANGSDAYTGTCETVSSTNPACGPWAHAPGMPNCAGICKSFTPTPGTGYIFRGGDTWHFGNTALATSVGTGCNNTTCWNWQWSGTSSAPYYLGIDPGWYSGSSWTRPIMSGDNPVWASSPGYPSWTTSCSYNLGSDTTGDDYPTFLEINQSWVTVDNFEFTGACFTGSPGQISYISQEGGVASNDVVENVYFHGWTRTSGAGESNVDILTIGGGATLADNNQYIADVLDGFDSPHWAPGDTTHCLENAAGCTTGGGIYGRANYVSQSIFRYLSDFVVSGTVCSYHDNLFEYLYNSAHTLPAQHANILNNDGVNACVTASLYNNTIRHVYSNEALYLTGPYDIFNNIFYDVVNATTGAVPAGCVYLIGSGSPQTVEIYNNTFGDGTCQFSPALADGGGTTPFDGGILWANNQFINYATNSLDPTTCSGGAFCPLNTNACTGSCNLASSTDNGGEVWQTTAAATAQGYTASNMYQPTASSNSTVDAGTNQTSLCPVFSPDSALCSGSSAGVTEVAGNGGYVASYPAVPLKARGSEWDSGAYQFSFMPINEPTTSRSGVMY
jgi:hypothetical protein